MKSSIHSRMLAALMLMCIVPSLRAQVVADGATNTLSNVTNTFTGDVTVGTNGSFTLLILSDNSLLTNSAQGVIGRNATARSNEVRLVSASARWHLGGSLQLGINGAANRLTVSNGGVVRANVGDVGILAASSNNVTVVTGSGSLWSNANELVMGFGSAGNQLVISNGGVVRNAVGYVGNDTSSSNNLAVVTDPGSLWTNASTLNIGYNGGVGNQLRVSNGGRVVNSDGFLGFSALSRSNTALVSGVGSIWSNQNNLIVGNSGSGNLLVVSNGATVLASNLFVGLNSSATNNRAIVDGGTLRVTNATGSSVLDVRRGTTFLNGGLIEVDILRLTNSQGGFFEFNGGTLSAKNSRFGNGLQFHVGDGVSPATFILAGNGTHDFSGTIGTMAVSSNAVLVGNGTLISGLLSGVNVRTGGTVSPGNPIGKMTFGTSPSLAGTVLMEFSKNGAALTNDQIQVTGKLTYDGTLIVTNLGPMALAAGDRFPLFTAGSYAGAFGTVRLPPLDPGLGWSNKLLVDGSIEVFDGTPFVTTLPATASSQTTATLNGMANPKGTDTTAWFEFGFTTNYGNVTSLQPLGGGANGTNFSQMLTGLLATAYHFRAVASNAFGVTFGADQSFNDPVITSQPVSRTNYIGTTAAFTVVVASAIPVSYRWQRGGVDLFDGVNVSGATTPTLSLSSVLPVDATNYSVVVSYSFGTLTSSTATLTVLSVPTNNLLSNPHLDFTYSQEIVPGFFLPKPSGWENVGTRTVTGPYEDEMSSEIFAGMAPTPVTTFGDGGTDWGVFFKPFSGGGANGPATGHLYQDNPALPEGTYTLRGWAGAEPNPVMSRAEFAVEFLNSSNNIINGTALNFYTNGLFVTNGQPFNYKQYTVTATAPPNTVFVRARVSMIDGFNNPSGGGQAFVVDDFSLTVMAPPGRPRITSISIVSPGGARRITAQGEGSRPYTLQSAGNLAASDFWLDFATTNANPAGAFEFLDADMITQRFYRLVAP